MGVRFNTHVIAGDYIFRLWLIRRISRTCFDRSKHSRLRRHQPATRASFNPRRLATSPTATFCICPAAMRVSTSRATLHQPSDWGENLPVLTGRPRRRFNSALKANAVSSSEGASSLSKISAMNSNSILASSIATDARLGGSGFNTPSPKASNCAAITSAAQARVFAGSPVSSPCSAYHAVNAGPISLGSGSLPEGPSHRRGSA